MKMRDWFPPVAVHLADRFRQGSRRKQYSTREEARADCGGCEYEDADLVEVVLNKAKLYRDEIARRARPIQLNAAAASGLCSLLTCTGSKEINVIDFGGACGAHYFLARALLPSACQLRWIVVETEKMAQRAKASLSTAELDFSSSLADAAGSMGHVDLIHTSGTLQCVDKPLDYLQSLVSLSATHILFNRLGLTRGGREVTTVHESWLSWNGPGPMPSGVRDRKIRYPFVFITELSFLGVLSNRYESVLNFEETSGMYPVEGEQIVGYGLLVRRM